MTTSVPLSLLKLVKTTIHNRLFFRWSSVMFDGVIFRSFSTVIPLHLSVMTHPICYARSMQFPTSLICRHYRTRRNLSHLTVEEQFVLKVLEEDGKNNISMDELNHYTSRLLHLVLRGCQAYELVEYPRVVYLTDGDIEARFLKLNSCGIEKPSIPLLRLANPSNKSSVVRRRVRLYIEQQHGHLNKVDEIANALECTGKEMLQILTRNPRLVGSRLRKNIVEKIRCLIDHGARLDDIRRNTNILNNKQYHTIKARAEQLSKLGFSHLLPVGPIGRDDEDYAAIVRQLEARHAAGSSVWANDAVKVFQLLPSFTSRHIISFRPTIEYLLRQGYQPRDIAAFPQIFKISLPRLCAAVSYLRQHHLGLVSLSICYHYAKTHRVIWRHGSLRVLLRRVIGCAANKLPSMPEDHSLRSVDEVAIRSNHELLLSAGFLDDDIISIPLVLTHSVDVLKSHLETLTDPDSDVPVSLAYRRCQDPVRRLNLLQYSIEHAVNFGHVSVSTGSHHLGTETDAAASQHENVGAVAARNAKHDEHGHPEDEYLTMAYSPPTPLITP